DHRLYGAEDDRRDQPPADGGRPISRNTGSRPDVRGHARRAVSRRNTGNGGGRDRTAEFKRTGTDRHRRHRLEARCLDSGATAMTARALIIGAPRSGSGKTSVTIGLLRAFARRGVKVRGIKTGPDYIDPGFHEAATGMPGLNLESWAMAPELLRHLANDHAEGAELLVIESAMGLFDGIRSEPNRTGAASDLARLFGVPVLLVLDVSGQSQTAAAVAYGFANYDPQVTIAGCILNRAGSERHRMLCTDAINEIGLPVLGTILRDSTLMLPERH